MPQSGDDLRFVSDDTDALMNDLVGLSVNSLRFESENDIFSSQWFLDGNELTVTGDITCIRNTSDLIVQMDCPITLGAAIAIQLQERGPDSAITFRMNGPLDLNGHDVRFLSVNTGDILQSEFQINSTIIGQGNLRFISRNFHPDSSSVAVFGGTVANTFTGLLSLERDAGARPYRCTFDKPGGNVVNTRLFIGDGCEVSTQRDEQIGDEAEVGVTGGGRLLLKGITETLGSLLLTNLHADAESTLVEFGVIEPDGTFVGNLVPRHGIVAFTFNESGAIPTIRGDRIFLITSPHVFNLQNPLLGPALDIQARIEGFGGFIKTGNSTLVLNREHAFAGVVEVREGVLEVAHSQALSGFGTNSGVVITDGSLTLRNVAIHDETLTVRGTRPVTANTTGSLLNSIGFSGWFGRIELDTNLVVNSTDLCILGGPIVGPGGFEFLGSRIQIAGDSSLAPSTYTGSVRSLCELLTLTDANALGDELIVGGGFSPQCEVRWTQDAAGSPRLTVHTNALVNLNGNRSGFRTLDFHGGRITTDSGTLSCGRVTVHPTNVTVTIDGKVSMASSGPNEFTVHDGPATPDFAVNAVIGETFVGSGLEKKGAGQMVLRGANTYAGPTLVDAGTLGVLNNDALGNATQGTTVENGATVAFGAQVDSIFEPFTIAGPGVDGSAGALRTVGDVFLNSDVVLSGNAAIRAEGTNSRLQVNNVSGIGPLTKLGSGRLVLRGNANNTYTGDTLVPEGVLDLAKPNNITSIPGHLIIGSSPGGLGGPSARVEHRASFTILGSVTVNGGGLWDLNGASEGWSILDLQGRPPLTLNDGGDVQTGAGLFILPAGSGIVVNPGAIRFGGSTISGRIALDDGPHRISVASGNLGLLGGAECNVTAAISETGATADLEKDGSGALRLAGTNTHRGATLVSGGVLQVDGVQPQSAARVSDGSRLQGVGTVGLIELLGTTATVLPGTSPSQLNPGTGILTCGNFNAGTFSDGVLFVKLNGTAPGTGHDQVNVRGTVRLTGLSLQGSLGFASSFGQQFTIINNDGTDAVQGTFDGLAENGTVYLGGERFTVSYAGGTGNDVVLTREVTPQLVVITLPATEVPNLALDFDGRFNRVHVGTNLFPSVGNNFTIELWAHPTAERLPTAAVNQGISDLSGQRHAIFPDHGDLGYGAGHAGAGLSIGTNGISVFEHAANYLPSLLVHSEAVTGWTHVALVYSNRIPRLYVNGVLARTGLPSTKNFVHPSANLGGSIQGLSYGNFQGQLDEVRIWNTVLSQAQIQANLNRSLTGAEPGLLMYFRCDDTNGVSIADSAPAGPSVNGTLLNGVASVLSGALPPASLNGPIATLNGMASPGGLDASTWFEWGVTTNYGNVTPAQSISAVIRTAGFSQTLAGLGAGVYQFRAVGSNGLHFSFGQNQSFTLLNGAPRLSIEAVTASQVRLLWPTSAVGFTLQANAGLNTTNWTAAGSSPSIAGTNNVAVDSVAGRQKFYRLFKP